ncbi:hypothetical protein SBDP1_30049 [Syntrophobacter sp. SbD1]|nr:hypothetical protein SBDP1_30049 [Syntrophobacter sp. SbD1]
MVFDWISFTFMLEILSPVLWNKFFINLLTYQWSGVIGLVFILYSV